jgi:hypothetical protein
MDLQLAPESMSVCRLDPAAQPTPPDDMRPLWSVSFTEDECSVVCAAGAEPAGSLIEPGWRVLRVVGTLDFALTGVLADLAGTLAAAGVSTFAVSTYDTDYFLVKDDDLSRAVVALTSHGHSVTDVTNGT